MSSLYRFADLTGDGTGSKLANVDGSVTPQVFKLAPRDGELYLRVERMVVHLADSGSLDSGAYGNNITLTNGITVEKRLASDDSVLQDLTDGIPITTNAHWGRNCYDVDPISFGLGDEAMNVRWTFSKAGKAIEINRTEYLAVVIRDNLTGLSDHTFKFDGTVKS